MGRAEDLFKRIKDEGIAAIDRLIAERASEELFLEFKKSADNGQGNRFHDHDRNHLRKAISGFANSEGGVVIWGVDCSRQANIGDVASSKLPLTNPARFVSWLEGAVSGCTVPPVIGVRSIPIPIDDCSGFVATYVPQSTHAPHQMTGEYKYMIRAGSDFVPAPHGVVAGLFGKPPHPVVFPNYILKPITFLDEYVQASFTVVLVNNGQVVAEDLFVSILTPDAPQSGQGISIDSKVDWPMAGALGFDRSLICPREFRLAPGGLISIVTVRLIIGQKAISDFRCNLTVGCKGAIPYSTELFVSKDDLDAELERIYEAKRNSNATFDFHKAAQTLLGINDS